MRIKAISRDAEKFTRQRSTEHARKMTNLDPALHPLERAREYSRALTATKMDRLFARPFIAALPDHNDAVYCMETHPSDVTFLASGACDGEIKLWDLSAQTCTCTLSAHRGFVRGLAMGQDGILLSIGDDKTVKVWATESLAQIDATPAGRSTDSLLMQSNPQSYLQSRKEHKPAIVFADPNYRPFSSIAFKYPKEDTFATGGSDKVHVWNIDRSEPVATWDWGEAFTSVSFCPVERDILLSTAIDKSVTLYDTRAGSPVKKVIMAQQCNTSSWNPQRTFYFALACDDGNVYKFDMRRFEKPVTVFRGHVAAVLDVDYSPSGDEFVTGSFDRTLRIFPDSKDHSFKSKEVYHTRRMKRIYTARFSRDGRYVLSGSQEGNVRIWKADASTPIGIQDKPQRHAQNYRAALIERYKHMPQVRRINNSRHLPPGIHKAAAAKRKQDESTRRKRRNINAHATKTSSMPDLKDEAVIRTRD